MNAKPILRGMLPFCLLAALLSCFTALAQTPPAPAPQPTSCCGPITPAGQHLLQVLDSMDVEHLWIASHKVEWRTGFPRSGKGGTHCSAFAAAVGERLGIYMLRPPEHEQLYLASAQGRWFEGEHAARDGWKPVTSAQDAQSLANQGNLVVIVFTNPDPHEHGHIAIVRPAIKSSEALAAEGPQTIQAGLHNFANGNALQSFSVHKAWPDNVHMYTHSIP
jgi:hypothetical protein